MSKCLFGLWWDVQSEKTANRGVLIMHIIAFGRSKNNVGVLGRTFKLALFIQLCLY